ncbi:hypothetical protein COEREDRAFT_79807, partial [Coemansia reversa NRRL 1564]
MLDDALKQVLLYSRNIYSSQHNRRFVWALTVCSTQVHVCLLLHDAVLVSETMDIAISDGRRQLIELLVNWSMCDQSQLGYDPTFYYNADVNKWIICCFDDDVEPVEQVKRKRKQQQQPQSKRRRQKSGEPTATPIYYKVDLILFTANNVEGRHTRCFVAEKCDHNGNSDDGIKVVIKDAWAATNYPPEQDPRSEIKLLRTISDKLGAVPEIDHLYPKILHGGHVRFMVDGKMHTDTTDTIFKLLNDERLDYLKTQDLETQQPQPQHEDDDVFGHSHASAYKPKTDWRFQPLRAHRRIVMMPVGRHIHRVQTQEELIIVLADAMRCHSSIYRHCGILHRDISENNIIVVRGDKDTSVQGLLIDYDYSIALTAENRGRRPGRSGTLPYMSIGNIENNGTQRTQLDDWESLLYLLCWSATIGLTSKHRNTIRQIDKITKRSILSKRPIHKWIEDEDDDIAYVKRNNMHSKDIFNISILTHFHVEYDKLILLASELHEALFLHNGCEGACILRKLPLHTPAVGGSNMPSASVPNKKSNDPLLKRVQYEQAIVENLQKIMSRYRKQAMAI